MGIYELIWHFKCIWRPVNAVRFFMGLHVLVLVKQLTQMGLSVVWQVRPQQPTWRAQGEKQDLQPTFLTHIPHSHTLG